MPEYSLRLPYPPSVNDYYGKRAVPSKKKPGKWVVIQYLSKAGREYRYTVTEMMYEQLGKAPKLRGRLAMIVKLHAQRPNDIDNGHKALLDSLEYAQLYINDEQVDQLLTVKKRRAATAYVEVVIKTL